MTDVRGLIDCCDEQVRYIKGHQGRKASIKNVVETKKPFHLEHRGSCEFCGQEWVAMYSHLTQTFQYRKVKDGREDQSPPAVQDDQG